MTTISAKVIADSINEAGNRLTTFQLRYPRWIHAEFMTHRVFSRNASSSRAIPVKKLIADVRADPAVPMFWGANQKGMQAGLEIDEMVRIWDRIGVRRVSREKAWLKAMENAIAIAEEFSEAGYHKQLVNRLLEPFSHINVVATATEWPNFYGLRRHKDAEPHIQLMADRMWEAHLASTPKLLRPGEWHLPYVDFDDVELSYRIKHSVACCASVSYKTVDGLEMTGERAILLHDKLVASDPLHASPAEHQGTPDPYNDHLWGNYKGWRQYRKMLPNECISSMG